MFCRVGRFKPKLLSLRILRSVCRIFIVLVDLIRWWLVLSCRLVQIYDAFLCFDVIGDHFRGGLLGHARLQFVLINCYELKLSGKKQRVDVRVACKRSTKPQQA